MGPDHSEPADKFATRPATRPAEPTLDGRRLGINELNLGRIRGRGKLKQFLRRLSQFLAGMYTGESCAGTPHDEQQSKRASQGREKS